MRSGPLGQVRRITTRDREVKRRNLRLNATVVARPARPAVRRSAMQARRAHHFSPNGRISISKVQALRGC
jgi:hypothetical protein